MGLGLEDLSLRARKLANKDRIVEALELANQAANEFPQEMQTWLLRGHLNELSGKYELAAADLTKAIELNSREPHLYYCRGRHRFELGDLQGAIDDFTVALDLCDFYQNDYYRTELHFWRAESLLQLGNKTDALRDLKSVPNDFSSWTFGLRRTSDLIRDCRS